MRKTTLAVAVVVILIIAAAAPALLLLGGEEKIESGVVLNEILYDPFGPDEGNEWVEIINTGKQAENLAGWMLVNRTGSMAAALPDWSLPAGAILTIQMGEGVDDSDFTDGEGLFYSGFLTEMNNTVDEVALCAGDLDDSTIVDFLCWNSDDGYVAGVSHEAAVKAGIWSEGDFYDCSFPGGRAPVAGFSLGRDVNSSDTDSSQDWDRDGGIDAYRVTPGKINAAPLFSVDEGIKIVQTQANLFLMEWGYDVLDANHSVLQEMEQPTESLVVANHTFHVTIGGIEDNLSGEGRYRWWKESDTLWKEELTLSLTPPVGSPLLNISRLRTCMEEGNVQTMNEILYWNETLWEIIEETEEESEEEEIELTMVHRVCSSNSTTTITQVASDEWSEFTSVQKWLGYRDEAQWINFSKNYTILENDRLDVWTELNCSSDSRVDMKIQSHYLLTMEVSWERFDSMAEVNATYLDYWLAYGEIEYEMSEEGHFLLERANDTHYLLNWSVPLETDDVPESTLDVGARGSIEFFSSPSGTVYRGQITSNQNNQTKLFCVDGYESVVGGGVCAIAGGIIGSFFGPGLGTIIGGGVGAAACGAVGLGIEIATEEDEEKPTIEFELGDSGSNKEKGWLTVTITISDNEGLDKIEYHSHSTSRSKTWDHTYGQLGESKTIVKTLINPKCVVDTRTITIKAWDETGNMAVDSRQIQVPARDCTPNVQNTTPDNEDCCVPTDSQIVVEFCKPMNTTSVMTALSIWPSIDYTHSWNEEETIITLTPTEELSPMTLYMVNISVDAKSSAEMPLLEPYSFSFTTMDPIGPNVTIVDPPDGWITDLPFVLVSGFATDNLGVTKIGINTIWTEGSINISTPLAEPSVDYFFEFEVELHEGANTIIVWAMDECGNYTQTVIMVMYTPP